jgi:hypothetical protein
MKKLIAIFAMVAALGANAFWNSNNTSGNGSYGNNNINGYQEDNGIFSYNPYSFYDPRWYFKEMINVIDEVDDEINSNSNNTGYGYNNTPRNKII